MDSRHALELVSDNGWQPLEEGRRQVARDVACGFGGDMKVVEQPFGGGRGRLSTTGVDGECPVGRAQRAHVVAETPQMRATAIVRPPSHGEEGGEAPGVFFQPVDTEQLSAAMWLRLDHLIDCHRRAHPTFLPPR